jgi:hypothetical protein
MGTVEWFDPFSAPSAKESLHVAELPGTFRLTATVPRGQLCDWLGRRVWWAWRRWLHSTSGRRPDDTVLGTRV